jgi:hypothetical protein
MSRQQLANTVLMVRPACFFGNPETAIDNAFQQRLGDDLTTEAQRASDDLAGALREAGVRVCQVSDTPEPPTPDALFPNNRISFHQDGVAVLYPLRAPSRMWEHELDVLPLLASEGVFKVQQVLDYRPFAKLGKYLEGTGSLVLDRAHRIAYAALSPRTHPDLVNQFCLDMGYHPVTFEAGARIGGRWTSIYHTNVMMSVGDDFAVVVADAIVQPRARHQVMAQLAASGRQVIALSVEQMCRFSANLLQLEATDGQKVVAISRQGYDALSEEQRQLIGRNSRWSVTDIRPVEAASGGSVRCMLAEVFTGETPDAND